MTVTSLDKDLDSLTLTLIADFDALSNASGNSGPTLEARALVVTADVPGDGGARPQSRRQRAYYMTGPEGEKPRGWWQISSVEPPKYLEFTDGFADDDGNPATDLPVMATSPDRDGGTRHGDAQPRVPRGHGADPEMGAAGGLQQAVATG